MSHALALAEELEKMAEQRMPLTGNGVTIGLSFSAKELRRQHAEIEALRKDAERLNYIAENWFSVSHLDIDGLHGWRCRVPAFAIGANVRQAIDAEKEYMEQEK
jgi:hypothetical protein